MKQHLHITKTSDVMVIDYGLHFTRHQLDDYKTSLKALLKMFKDNIISSTPIATTASSDISGCHLIYRETSAQHFDQPDGHYKSLNNGKFNLKCVPHSGNSSLSPGGVTARTQTLVHAAESEGYALLDPYGNILNNIVTSEFGDDDDEAHHHHRHELTLLPFWNFTSKLSYLHGIGNECTHFCYSPHLWVTSWRHLRNALDRLVVNV